MKLVEIWTVKKTIYNTDSKYLNEFIVGDKGRVERRSYDGNLYQLLGNILIIHKSHNEFRIIKTQSKYILLGIVDAKYINDRNSYGSKRRECILYSAYNGNILLNGEWIGA